jgi:hypothetical protein
MQHNGGASPAVHTADHLHGQLGVPGGSMPVRPEHTARRDLLPPSDNDNATTRPTVIPCNWNR